MNYLEKIYFSVDEITSVHRAIGNEVAKQRILKNITQLDLALTIGYSSTSVIAKAEAGTENRHFSVEQLYKISKALEIPIEIFFKNIN